MNEYYSILTNKGAEVLYEALTNSKAFNPCFIAVGDSLGNYYEPEETQLTLKNEKYRARIYAKGKKDNCLYFDMQIPASEGDYTIREVGLFSEDNELLGIAKYPATLKQKADTTSDKTLSIEFQIYLSNEVLNTIVIDNRGNLLTQEDADVQPYNKNRNYSKGRWVTDILDNKKTIFESLTDNNQNNPLTDATNWKKVSLGGNGIQFLGQSLYSKYETNNPCLILSDEQENLKSLYPALYNWILQNVNKGIKDFKGKIGYAYIAQNAAISYISTPNPVINQAVYRKENDVIYIDGYIEEITDTGFSYTNIDNNIVSVVRSEANDTTDWICDYDFVIDVENETFRLPLLDGTEDLPGDSFVEVKNSDFAINETLVAAQNGVYTFLGVGNSAQYNGQLWIRNSTSGSRSNIALPNTIYGAVCIEAKRGDKILLNYQQITPSSLLFSAHKGNGKLYYYSGDEFVDEDIINLGNITEQTAKNGGDITRLQKKMSPGYKMTGYALSTTVNLVQEIPFDCYIRTQTAANSNFNLSICDADGTHRTVLVKDNIQGYTWTPLIKKGEFVKIESLTNSTNCEVVLYRAEGGITNE